MSPGFSTKIHHEVLPQSPVTSHQSPVTSHQSPVCRVHADSESPSRLDLTHFRDLL